MLTDSYDIRKFPSNPHQVEALLFTDTPYVCLLTIPYPSFIFASFSVYVAYTSYKSVSVFCIFSHILECTHT